MVVPFFLPLVFLSDWTKVRIAPPPPSALGPLSPSFGLPLIPAAVSPCPGCAQDLPIYWVKFALLGFFIFGTLLLILPSPRLHRAFGQSIFSLLVVSLLVICTIDDPVWKTMNFVVLPLIVLVAPVTLGDWLQTTVLLSAWALFYVYWRVTQATDEDTGVPDVIFKPFFASIVFSILQALAVSFVNGYLIRREFLIGRRGGQSLDGPPHLSFRFRLRRLNFAFDDDDVERDFNEFWHRDTLFSVRVVTVLAVISFLLLGIFDTSEIRIIRYAIYLPIIILITLAICSKYAVASTWRLLVSLFTIMMSQAYTSFAVESDPDVELQSSYHSHFLRLLFLGGGMGEFNTRTCLFCIAAMLILLYSNYLIGDFPRVLTMPALATFEAVVLSVIHEIVMRRIYSAKVAMQNRALTETT